MSRKLAVVAFKALLMLQSILVRAQPPPDLSWASWYAEMAASNLFELIPRNENFSELLKSFCDISFPDAERAKVRCYDYYVDVGRKTRVSWLSNQSIPVRVLTSECASVNFQLPSGVILSLTVDQQDDARQVATAIALYANVSRDQFDKILSSWTPAFTAAISVAEKSCKAAQLRRERRVYHENLSNPGGEPHVYLSESSVRCEHPYSNHEWLTDELRGHLPLGLCRYKNLYIFNNVWYYASDADGTPNGGVRLNTINRHPSSESPPFKPIHVSMEEMKDLMEYTGPKRVPTEYIRVCKEPYKPSVRIILIFSFIGLTQNFNNTLFLIKRLVSANHGHMLFDIVLPVLWSLDQLNFNISDVGSILNDEFQVVVMDNDPPDALDDRIRILTPNRAPIYNNKTPFGNLCEPGVWCVYSTVYGAFRLYHLY